MRLLPLEIIDNLEMIVKVSQESVDTENPHSIALKINRLSSLLGLGSKCCGNAEYYYQTNRKSPEFNELRTFADTINKDLHYIITSLQSILKVTMIDYVDSKNQN